MPLLECLRLKSFSGSSGNGQDQWYFFIELGREGKGGGGAHHSEFLYREEMSNARLLPYIKKCMNNTIKQQHSQEQFNKV